VAGNYELNLLYPSYHLKTCILSSCTNEGAYMISTSREAVTPGHP
jgi:hypothetical protein